MNEQSATNATLANSAMVGLVERLTSEGLINLSEAGKMLGTSRGSTVGPATISRWIVRGIKVNGQTHRLEGLRIGGRRFMTSRQAVCRFLAAQQALVGNDELFPAIPRTPTVRAKANAKAAEELTAMGI